MLRFGDIQPGHSTFFASPSSPAFSPAWANDQCNRLSDALGRSAITIRGWWNCLEKRLLDAVVCVGRNSGYHDPVENTGSFLAAAIGCTSIEFGIVGAMYDKQPKAV
ncbi:uncharacterized protein PG986_003739 [Apiospora aurea]|uniref:Uncharacterized protein n=1 Tax=Apiospora aurea TaxID=335848 RepID=A0ABR1QSK1_9PEZI